MSTTSRPVVKLRSPMDVIGTVPHLVGFQPRESLVVLCLTGPRRRTGLTMRIDLPGPGEGEEDLAAEVDARVAKANATAVLLVCYTEAEAAPPGPQAAGSPLGRPARRTPSGQVSWSPQARRAVRAAQATRSTRARGPNRSDGASGSGGEYRSDGAYRSARTDGADEPSLPRRALVARTAALLHARGVDVPEALLVAAGRWYSYLCGNSCCPTEGTPLPSEPSEAMTLIAAESVGTGRVVLADRGELAASIRPRRPLAAVREHAADQAVADYVQECLSGGVEAARSRTLVLCRAARKRAGAGRASVDAGDAARIVVGLRDVQARDEVGTWGIDPDVDTVLPLLVELASHASDQDAAPVCTVLAWVAYQWGDGALANVALERALRAEPDYTMAQLLLHGLQNQVAPEQVRSVSRQVRRDLQAARRRSATLDVAPPAPAPAPPGSGSPASPR